MTANSARRSSLVLGLCALATALLLTGCTTGSEDRDWAGEAASQLGADGVDPDIVECVLDVGRHELERGPFSDAAKDELRRNCRAAAGSAEAAEQSEEPVDELALVDRTWSFGDDPALDELWTDCESGSGAACDQLFEQSPVGSHYEEYGVTCGDRPELLNCAELDLPDEATD